MDASAASSSLNSHEATSPVPDNSTIRPTFLSLLRELRNIVYDALWASSGIVSTHLNGILLRVHYRCVEATKVPFTFGIPKWLLTCKSFLFEALDLLRLNSMWVLHHRQLHHRQVWQTPWAPKETPLLDPNVNMFRCPGVALNPIKVLRLSYSLIAVSDYSAQSMKVPEWYYFAWNATRLQAIPRSFQLEIINMQEKYAITKELNTVPYWPKYRKLCDNYIKLVGYNVIERTGTLSTEVGEGVPTRSVLFTYA